ncbi:MAG: hypothetical protein A3B70_08110 [Deltaproteobacteria bacterium RIFCSPHIGHO2_02_FULL_40_11]|nr:MAG: hypothetical protein A3B70_08110 [Deltaproteobacteria bacterium RIFCSPHIGHO2_02_FULL_40_11]
MASYFKEFTVTRSISLTQAKPLVSKRHRISKQRPPSRSFFVYEIIRDILFATLIILSAILVYFSAIQPFKTSIRAPQSLTQNYSNISQNWSKIQANLYYKMAAEAYGKGDYALALNHIEQAQYLNLFDPKFIKLKKAIDEAKVLQQTFVQEFKAKAHRQWVEDQVAFHLGRAQRLIDQKEWDLATIAYQEALMVDPYNEPAKNGIDHMDSLRRTIIQKSAPLEKPSLTAIDVFQKINHILSQAQDLENQQKYSNAISLYKDALTLAKTHDFKTSHIMEPLKQALKTLTHETQTLWAEAETLIQAQKYKEAKVVIEKILFMNPKFQPAKEKHVQLNQILAKQVKMLYSQAAVYENLPDISAAKSKWQEILNLTEKEHPYYIKAKEKLLQYVSL